MLLINYIKHPTQEISSNATDGLYVFALIRQFVWVSGS